MVDLLAITLAVAVVGVTVLFHYARGAEWTPREDVSEELLERRAEAVPETDFPEPMNRSIGGGVAAAAAVGEAAGESAELDDEGAEESGPAAIPEEEVEHYEIEFAKEGETIDVANNETILEAGEDEGWDLPYACREGQCLSCSARIVDGPSEDYVVHDDQEMLEESELDDGYTLTCVAYPRSEFSIETSEAT